MRPEQDAYGQILHDIHTGANPEAGEIIERDDGFIQASGPATIYFEEYENWSEQIQNAISHAHKNTVDVGCGAGRHSLYLQEETDAIPRAIDVSPKAVDVAQDRGVKRTSVAGLDDLASLPEAPYHTVLMVGNNLGLLGTKPIERLNMIAEATTNDAVLIGQTREATATDNPDHLQYHEFNKSRGRRPGCLRMRIRYRNFKTDWYDYLYIDFEELKVLLEQTVWTVTEHYHEGAQYTVVLEKET